MLWWPCGAGATDWKTEKLGEFPLGLLQVEFLRKQILNLEFAFGGLLESHLNKIRGSKRTRKWQKKLSGDTYSCNSGLSLSCMKF